MRPFVMRPGQAWAALTTAYFVVVFVILLAPLAVVVGSSFSAPVNENVATSYVPFPPERLTLRWYARIPATQLHALGVSFVLGLAVSLAACLVGVPAALALARGQPGRRLAPARHDSHPIPHPALWQPVARRWCVR